MNFVFGSTVSIIIILFFQFVADDEETAKKVAYNNFARFLCVTLKGDKYNPQGTLEGGFNKSDCLLS